MKMKKVLIVCMLLAAFALALASCDESALENIVPNHTHQFGEWKTVLAPTCTETGREERACECGVNELQLIAALGHTEVIDAAKEATCAEDGLTEGKHCGVCNEVIMPQETLKAKEHVFVDHFCECGATDGTVSAGLLYELTEDGQGYAVSIGTCTDAEIVIPQMYKGLPITAVKEKAFMQNQTITSVVIPEGVTVIEGRAFYQCEALESVTIPDSVTTIEVMAFKRCYSLVSVTLPDSLTEISNSVFCDCGKITSLTLPEGIKRLGSGAFANCSCLESINIPDSITVIEVGLFEGCSSLKSIIIPDGVTLIMDSAFRDCLSLESITIPSGITSIGAAMFEGCSSITSFIVPDGITLIDLNAFLGCGNLKELVIPSSVTEIRDGAFGSCPCLTDITFKGTKEQWIAAIGKYNWYYHTVSVIHCIDGDITIE